MPLLSLAGISFCLDMVSGDHQNRWIQFILLHSFYSPPRASCFSSNRQRWRYTEARDGTAPLAIQPADQAKWKKLGGPLFMRLGKCVLLKEADSLLGYTDGILRDLKDAEMAIREINSTWHDTARGVAYHPAPPAPQPSLTPGRAGDPSRFLLRHSRHRLYRKLLGRLRRCARRAGPRSSEAFCFLVSRPQCRPHVLRALPFRDSARVCFNYHLY